VRSAGRASKQVSLVLIKPSHYDDDGYAHFGRWRSFRRDGTGSNGRRREIFPTLHWPFLAAQITLASSFLPVGKYFDFREQTRRCGILDLTASIIRWSRDGPCDTIAAACAALVWGGKCNIPAPWSGMFGEVVPGVAAADGDGYPGGGTMTALRSNPLGSPIPVFLLAENLLLR